MGSNFAACVSICTLRSWLLMFDRQLLGRHLAVQLKAGK